MGNADRQELGAELTGSFCSMDPEIGDRTNLDVSPNFQDRVLLRILTVLGQHVSLKSRSHCIDD